MTVRRLTAGEARAVGRRAAMMLPLLSLGACSIFDDLFYTSKTPLAGRRENLMAGRRGLDLSLGPAPRVVLPPAIANADWPQPGGNPLHAMGHLAVADRLAPAWSSDIGEGGGYRAKITSQPVVAGGRVFTMDSDGEVRAFTAATGVRGWSTDTQPQKDRSTNVGGGLAFDGGVIYAATGRAELLALDAASGTVKWRKPLGAPARSSPTVADGRVYVSTIEQKLGAWSATDGSQLWSFQASQPDATVLGAPAPAFSDGLVVAGFGSGDIATVRAASGAVVWTDSIAASSGRTSLADMSAIGAMPVISNGTVYVIGLGGLMVAIDLRSGRRLWEREVAGSQMPCVAGPWMFVVTLDQTLACLNAGDGRVAWVADLPRYENEQKQRDPIIWTGPLLAGDRLVLGGSDKRALAVSPYDGHVLGQQTLPGPSSVAPVAAGGTVFFVTDDGKISAVR